MQFNLFPSIKVKLFLQEIHWLSLHISQLLYSFSHLIKIDGSIGSGIYVLFKSLNWTQFDLFPLINSKPFLQDMQKL